jgi:hypothetical protein
MARKAFNERRKAIAESLARMLLHYVRSHFFQDLTDKEFSDRTGITGTSVTAPWFTDIPEICEGVGLDLGIAVRDSKGNELIFWPTESLAAGYKPPKIARKPLPPLPPRESVVTYDYRTGQRGPLNHAGAAASGVHLPRDAAVVVNRLGQRDVVVGPKQLTLEGEFED